MKFLLKLIVAAASLAGIVLVIAFFVDRSFEVKRSDIISANRQETFEYFKNLENHEDFNVWLNQDPDANIWYEGTPGEIGYKMHWKSSNNRVGEGTQEIITLNENESIEYKVDFVEPQSIQANLIVQIEDNGPNESKVTWQMKGEIPYPWNLSLLFKDIEGQIGLDLEKGLKNASPLIVN